jgi:hypothetical protein
MEALAWIIGTLLVVMAGAWWAERRWQRVDSYYEHEYQDPPVFDAGSWLGGDRGMH